MNASAVNVAVVDGKTITQTVELSTVKNGQPIRIKAVQGGKYILAEGANGVAPENITIKRVGKDLHIALEGSDPDQPQLIIEDFEGSGGQLVGVAEDGSYHEYISSDAEQDRSAAFLIEGVEAPQVLGAQQLTGFGDGLASGAGIGWFWPALLGLGALGLLGGVYAATRDDDNGNDSGGNADKGSIGGADDNVGDRQGLIESGGSTDDRTPTFTGDGRPGTSVEIIDNGKVIGTVIVGEDGKWEYTPPEPGLDDGSHNIVIVPVDENGNKGEPSPEYEIIVDTVAPSSPLIDGAYDDVAPNEGQIGSGGHTNDTTPTLSGTGEADAIIHIYDNGVEIGSVLADADGKWSYTPDPALSEGAHEFTITAEDAAGNISTPSLPFPIIVDITAPTKPGEGSGAVDDAIDNVGPVQGSIENGGTTDDKTPTFTGGGLEPGDTVVIIDNGTEIGTAIVDEDGNWEFTPPEPGLEDGSHEIVVVIKDPAGNVSEPSDPPYVIVIDPSAPGKPGAGTGGIDDILDNVGPIQGSIEDGDETDDTTPTLIGSGGEPGNTVVIIDNGTEIGTAIVDEDGNWEFTPNPELAEGSHEVVVVIKDPAGNESEPSDPHTIIVDTSAPVVPTLGSVVDDQGTTTGDLTSGDITDDASPDLSGTAEAGSLVTIYDNGVAIGSVIATNTGTWTFTPTLPLSNGSHSLTVTATDAAGNVSAPTPGFDLEVVAGGAPTAPAIISIVDDQGSAQGPLAQNDFTDDAQPTINGTGTNGDTISVFANGVLLGTTTVVNGQWSFTPSTPLADGLHNLTAQATNAAGNSSPATGDYPINVDTTAPVAPVGQTLSDDVGDITGPIAAGDTTDDANPTFGGTAEAGSVVMIYDNGVLIGSTAADAATGAWSFTPSTPLANGAHSLSAQVVDSAGNVGPMGPAIAFTVDTSAVVISITSVVDDAGTVTGNLTSGDATDDTTPTLNGQATPGGIVSIYDGATLLGTVVADATTGLWSYTTPVLSEGAHSLTATVTTPAGGESAPTPVFDTIIDTTAPGVPAIGGVTDDVGAIQGPVTDGNSTDDTTPTLSGDGLQPGDSVEIRDGGALIGTTTVGTDGSWSYTPTTPLNDGSHAFTIVAVDPAGNASAPSAPWTIDIDTTAPIASAIVDSMGKDSGANSGDFVTNDGAAGRLIQGSLTAALSAGESVQVSIDSGTTWLDVLLNGDGTWSFVDNSSHSANWTIQTRVVDAVGNTTSASQLVTLDTAAPNAPSTLVLDGNTATVGLVGTNAVEGDTVKIVFGDHTVDYTLTSLDVSAGTVDIEISQSIIDANPDVGKFSAGIVDTQGNSSDYRVSVSGPTLAENFESEADIMLGDGESIDTGVMLITKNNNFAIGTDGISNFNSFGKAWIVSGGATADLKGLSATGLSFKFADSEALHRIVFKDSAGNVVHSESFGGGSYGSFLAGTATFTMPEGVSFTSFEFEFSIPAGSPHAYDTLVFDEFLFTGLDSTVTTPPVEQNVVVGSDSYQGTGDDNQFNVGDLDYFAGAKSSIDGGNGVDTLLLTEFDQALDLSSLGDKLSSIEVIDLTGTGNNTLNLSLGDVLEQGETSLFTSDETVQMMVKGNAGDVVNLDDLLPDGTDPGDWAAAGTATVAGVEYSVYQHSTLDAQLLVQDGVTTNLV